MRRTMAHSLTANTKTPSPKKYWPRRQKFPPPTPSFLSPDLAIWPADTKFVGARSPLLHISPLVRHCRWRGCGLVKFSHFVQNIQQIRTRPPFGQKLVGISPQPRHFLASEAAVRGRLRRPRREYACQFFPHPD